MSATDIADKAIQILNERITDEIFLIIQEDRELMHEYLREVEDSGLDSVNQQIGKRVKNAYGLTNADDKKKNPESTLIQSHQVLELN